VNVEPYGTVQIMLFCNKSFWPWMISQKLSWMFG